MEKLVISKTSAKLATPIASVSPATAAALVAAREKDLIPAAKKAPNAALEAAAKELAATGVLAKNIDTISAMERIKAPEAVKVVAAKNDTPLSDVEKNDVNPVDAYKELYDSASGGTDIEPANSGRDYTVEEAQEAIMGGQGTSPSTVEVPATTTPAATPTVEKKWYEKLLEDKVKLAIIAAAIAVLCWLIFKKD